jgi:hypothetical protein
VKTSERDTLIKEQSEALRLISEKLTSLNRREPARASEPPAIRRPPRPRLDGLPGWDHVVPVEHVRGDRVPEVNCVCGAVTALTLRIPMECGGRCGRYFMRTRAGVTVKRFEEPVTT